MASIIFQIARNKVLFGNDLEVDAHLVGNEGRIQIQGPNGPVLRPLGFGERNRLVRMAAQSSSIPSELAAVIKQAAVVEPGTAEVPALALEALALHLCGAGSGAPGFSTQTGILSHQFGWTPKELENQNALEVDSLAAKWMEAHDSVQPDDGWHRIVLQPGASTKKDETDLESLVEELAQDLIDRFNEMLNREVFEQSRKQSGKSSSRQTQVSPVDSASPSKFQQPGSNFSNQNPGSPESEAWNTEGDIPGKGNIASFSDTPVSQTSKPDSPPATHQVSPTQAQNDWEKSPSVQPSLKDEPVSTSARSNLKSDSLEETPEQNKPRHPASDPEKNDLKDPQPGAPDQPLPKAPEDFDWGDLGLNTSPFENFDPEKNQSSPSSHSWWREEIPSKPDPIFQETVAVTETGTRQSFPESSSGIQQVKQQSSAFQLEPLQGSDRKDTKNSKPGSSQDVIQTIADALHRMADLRGIDP